MRETRCICLKADFAVTQTRYLIREKEQAYTWIRHWSRTSSTSSWFPICSLKRPQLQPAFCLRNIAHLCPTQCLKHSSSSWLGSAMFTITRCKRRLWRAWKDADYISGCLNRTWNAAVAHGGGDDKFPLLISHCWKEMRRHLRLIYWLSLPGNTGKHIYSCV